jgi:hypothetical protein
VSALWPSAVFRLGIFATGGVALALLGAAGGVAVAPLAVGGTAAGISAIGGNIWAVEGWTAHHLQQGTAPLGPRHALILQIFKIATVATCVIILGLLQMSLFARKPDRASATTPSPLPPARSRSSHLQQLSFRLALICAVIGPLSQTVPWVPRLDPAVWLVSATLFVMLGLVSGAMRRETAPGELLNGCLRIVGILALGATALLIGYCAMGGKGSFSIGPPKIGGPAPFLATRAVSRTDHGTTVTWRAEKWKLDSLLYLEFDGRETLMRLQGLPMLPDSSPLGMITLKVEPAESGKTCTVTIESTEVVAKAEPQKITAPVDAPYTLDLCRVPDGNPPLAYNEWKEIATIHGKPLRVVIRKDPAETTDP